MKINQTPLSGLKAIWMQQNLKKYYFQSNYWRNNKVTANYVRATKPKDYSQAFFGKPNTAHWEMNEALLNVITIMMQVDKSCFEAMDFVPRPGVYPTPKDVLKELERIAKWVMSGEKSYDTCKTAVAYKWRTEAEMAAKGL